MKTRQEAPVSSPRTKTTSPVKTLSLAIEQRRASFASVQTRYLPADRLVKLGQVVATRVPRLAECSLASVLDALMTCARLGLEPHEPGGVWLVPYRIRDRYVCQAIVDYRGLIDVARRSGEIAAIHADERRAADGWEYAVDTTAPTLIRLRHVPAEGDRGPLVGAYAIAKLRNGECQAVYLTADDLAAIRARSPSAQAEGSPWVTDPAAMHKKSALRRLVNLLPRTPDLQVLREELVKEEVREMKPGTPEPLVLPEPAQELPAQELPAEAIDFGLAGPPEGESHDGSDMEGR